MIKQIFLDIDGVLNCGAPWFAIANGVHIDPLSYDVWPTQFGYDIVAATNFLLEKQGDKPISSTSFWSVTQQEDFWIDFPKSSQCDRIVRSAANRVGEKNVFLLSSTTLAPESASGKIRWIEFNLPKFLHRQYLFGPVKHAAARPDRLLIDDSDQEVLGFRKAGGAASLVPRAWNSDHARDTDRQLSDLFNRLQSSGPGGCLYW